MGDQYNIETRRRGDAGNAPSLRRPVAASPRRGCCERGFTLLELMIVISIGGILLTLAQPSFSQSILRAREAALKQNLFAMREVLDQYRADRGHYPSALADLASAGYLKRVPVDPFTKSSEMWQEIRDQLDGGVFDIHSGSDLVALDGTPYNQW